MEQVVFTPASGPVNITTYQYTDPDGDDIGAGRLAVVTVDDKSTSYTFNSFGDLKTVMTEFGTATTTYSDELEDTDPAYFLPARVIESEDPAGNIVEYTYNSHDQVETIVAAPGEAEEQTTNGAFVYTHTFRNG